MLFKGIGRTFSTENDHQFETIGAFCDECPDFPCADVMEKKPGTGRSTRSANPHWRICVSSGKPGWLLFWNANGDSGPVPTAETSSVSIQVFAAAVADSIMVQ